jgi:hypothetical protein
MLQQFNVDHIEDDLELLLEYQLENLSNQLAQVLAEYDHNTNSNKGHNTRILPNMTAYKMRVKELETAPPSPNKTMFDLNPATIEEMIAQANLYSDGDTTETPKQLANILEAWMAENNIEPPEHFNADELAENLLY